MKPDSGSGNDSQIIGNEVPIICMWDSLVDFSCCLGVRPAVREGTPVEKGDGLVVFFFSLCGRARQ